ncbi:MAG: DUF4158 domain-containing protein [Anaerolineae bacterium]|nr:DUF4158 domain-containing protein [Anaerolineae bacterium]
MPPIPRTAYPSLERQIRTFDLDDLFTPDADDIQWAKKIIKGDRWLLSLMVLLKCTEALGYFPVLEQIPDPIVAHIRAYLSTSKAAEDDDNLQMLHLSKATLYERYQPEIRARLGLQLFTSTHKENLQRYLVDATQTQHSTVDLINAAVEWLFRERVELPAFATLRRICSKVNNDKHASIQNAVVSRLPRSVLTKLNDLLKPAKGKLLAEWARIREKPGPPTLSALRDYLHHASGCGAVVAAR